MGLVSPEEVACDVKACSGSRCWDRKCWAMPAFPCAREISP